MKPLPSFLLSLLVAGIVLAVVSVIDSQENRVVAAADRERIRQELTATQNALVAALDARLYHARGLAAFVVSRPNYSMGDFERFAGAIQARQEGIRSLQLSPNAVVTYITNHEQNRASLGDNLLTDGDHHALVRKSIDERRLVIVGPQNLKQGGTAIIARQPIFLPDPDTGKDDFWGFATVLIDIPPLLAQAGINSPPPGVRYSLRGKHGLGDQGEVFFGDPDVFDKNPVMADIALPTGSWQIAAVRTGAAATESSRWRLWLWAGGLALSLATAWLLYFFLRRPAQLSDAVDAATAALQESRQALQRSEELYVRATQAGKVGVWDWNLTTDAISFSRELEEMLGCGDGERIESFADFRRHVRPEDADRQKREALAYLAGDGDQDFVSDYALELPDGELRWFATRANKLFDDDGNVIGITGTDMDITETRRAQEALRQAKEQAETANRTKTDFLANISHELRTPLNSVLGFAELIRDQVFGPGGDQRYHEYAGDIHRSGSHLLDVINEILDVSRIEAGAIEIVEEEVDLASVIASSVTMIADRAEKGRVELHVDIDADLPTYLGDATRLKQIVLNLLSNAVKFTAPEGKITVRCGREENGDVRISVADTGIGIAAHQLERIFEPFTQIENIQQRSHEGAGLGLTLVRSLAMLHGGRVEIDSEPGSGTAVYVHLPADRVIEQPSKTNKSVTARSA